METHNTKKFLNILLSTAMLSTLYACAAGEIVGGGLTDADLFSGDSVETTVAAMSFDLFSTAFSGSSVTAMDGGFNAACKANAAGSTWTYTAPSTTTLAMAKNDQSCLPTITSITLSGAGNGTFTGTLVAGAPTTNTNTGDGTGNYGNPAYLTNGTDYIVAVLKISWTSREPTLSIAVADTLTQLTTGTSSSYTTTTSLTAATSQVATPTYSVGFSTGLNYDAFGYFMSGSGRYTLTKNGATAATHYSVISGANIPAALSALLSNAADSSSGGVTIVGGVKTSLANAQSVLDTWYAANSATITTIPATTFYINLYDASPSGNTSPTSRWTIFTVPSDTAPCTTSMSLGYCLFTTGASTVSTSGTGGGYNLLTGVSPNGYVYYWVILVNVDASGLKSYSIATLKVLGPT